jgi:hypothetical protein
MAHFLFLFGYSLHPIKKFIMEGIVVGIGVFIIQFVFLAMG